MENFSQATEPGHLSEDMLNEYLDGYLMAEVSVTVEKHLAQCPDCAERYHQLQALFADLEDLPDLPLQRDSSRVVVDAIHSQPQLPMFVKWGMFPQLGIAVFILLALLPRYLQGCLAVLPKAIDELLEPGLLTWFAASKAGLGSLQIQLPAWQLPSLTFNFQFHTLNHFNWLLFAVVFELLLIANGLLLRQVSHNGSD